MKEIKNLNQLKKAFQKGARFVITDAWRKEQIGQVREVNVVQTNAIYSVVPGEPENPVSTANGGRGYFLEYGKAGQWQFRDGKCRLFNKVNGEMMLEFEVL